MKRQGSLVILLLCLICIAACNHVQGYLDIIKAKGMSGAYLLTLKHWTRSQTVYSQFETKVHIEATLRSPEFNSAYLQEYARIYQLSLDEQKRWEELRAVEASEATEFIFYAYTPNKIENDFDRRGSIWSIFLINEKGERIKPSEVRRIEPITTVVTEFFPYGNPHYGVFYRLRFSHHESTGRIDGPMRLIFNSVNGQVELEFEGL